jgi:hypothetical protein
MLLRATHPILSNTISRASPVSRSLRSPAEERQQWLPTANSRTARSLRARPIDRFAEDRAATVAVPPPPPVGFTARIRPPRDRYVRIFGNV